MTKIANYTIEGVIGAGGMGQVLRGHDPFGRQVAIKEILPEFVNNSEYRKRIDREIKVMRALNDPYVVKVYKNFELNGYLYIVMELVDGINLEQYVAKHGVFSLEKTAEIMHKLLGTMQYVHNEKIIHRDIKPGNVMIRSNGEICVLDFGIAKDISSENPDDERTQIGMVLGTDGYMSPEQANGYAVDYRTDIYSLGCVMFFMLTGQHAYVTYADNSALTTSEISEKPFPRLTDYRSDLSDGVQQVLDKATNKNMLRRYQSCRDFSDDITKKCEGGGTEPLVIPNPIPAKVTISIGRENCDITTPPQYKKISRRHCDVEVRQMTGGQFYRIVDHSANGTMVNGRVLKKGDKADIRVTDTPNVVLCNDPYFELDWNHVKEAIYAKQGINPGGIGGNGSNGSNGNGDNGNGGNGNGDNGNGGNGNGGNGNGGNGNGDNGNGGNGNGGSGSGIDIGYKYQQTRGMSFGEAVKSCFNKYAYFRGRASRSEYWYFYLFNFLVCSLFGILQLILIFNDSVEGAVFINILLFLFGIAISLPGLAVTVRRLHDTDRSGANLLWLLLPIVGSIILLVFLLTPGTRGPNNYGPEP